MTTPTFAISQASITNLCKARGRAERWISRKGIAKTHQAKFSAEKKRFDITKKPNKVLV